jgi:PAS domain S-box-containing protein
MKKPTRRTVKAGRDGRKRSGTALKALSTRLELILSAVPDIIMEVDNDKVYTWANQAGLDFFGADVIGKEAAFYFEGEQKTYQIVQPVFAGAEDVIYVESWQRRRDGQKRLLAWRCRTLKDEFGNVKGALSAAADITERKRMEEELRISEDKFKYVFDHSVIGKSITLPSGEVNSNKALSEMLGYSREELNKRRWQDITHPDDIELTQKALDSIISGEKDSARFVKRYIHKNGSIVWGDISTSLRRDQEGNPLYFMSSVLDITERKQAEERLASQHAMLQAIINSPEDIIVFSLDKEYRYTAFNDKHRREMKTVWKVDIQIGMNLLDCMNIPELRQAAKQSMDRALRGESFSEVQHQANLDIYYEFNWNPIIQGKEIVGVAVFVRDITDRKRAEDALVTSEEKFRKAFYTSPDAVSINHLADGLYVSINTGFTKIMGYSEEEIVGRTSIELNIWDDPGDRQRLVAGLRENGIVENLEARFRAKNGDLKYGLVAATLIEIDRRPHLLGIVRDITDRKQAENILWESEKKYRTLFDEAPVGIAISTIEGKIIDVNKAQAEMIGCTVEELIGRNVNEYYVNPDKRKEMIEVFKENRKVRDFEMQLKRKDGSIVTELLNLNEVKIGKKDFIFVTGRDITERKRTEGMLVKSEKRFRQLSDLLPQIVFETDIKGTLTFANQFGLKSVGYSPEDIRAGINILALVAPEDRESIQGRFQEILSGSETAAREFQLIQKDGEKFPILMHANAILEDGVPIGVRGIAIDITQLKKADAKLHETLDGLRRALGGIIQVLSAASEKRDPYTAGHQRRVADLARAIAREMGLAQDRVEGIRVAGIIHDVGKLSIPAEILSKPARLTEIEYELVKSHAQIGHDILGEIEFGSPIAQMILQHHERMDGSGYPQRLKGDDILLESRILAVSDVIEAMASHRPYRPALGIEAALKEIEKNKGILYDAAVVSACLTLFREKGYALKE